MSQTSISVDIRVYEDGRIRPLRLRWHDHVLPIDRLLDVRPGASLKIGCAGIRYTCRVQGKLVYLFNDDDQWYLEPLPE